MSQPLDIVAMGARTPLGLTAESSAAAVRAGVSGFGEFPFVMLNGDLVTVCADRQLGVTPTSRERLAPLVSSALDEALGGLESHLRTVRRCYLLLALPEARPGFSDRDAAWVTDRAATQLRHHHSEVRVGLFGRGHAGAIQAVAAASQESDRGADGLFFVVGADSYLDPDTFLWLEAGRRFAQPTIRSGFIPGEGAACLALCSPSHRRTAELPALAIVEGVGTGRETLLRDSETGSLGAGMSDAVFRALQGAGPAASKVDTIYSDINGERYRSEEWGFVAMKAWPHWASLEYEAPASCWGDVGAAFAPLACVLAIQSYRRHYARGPSTLVMAGSDSGLRGALVLRDLQRQSTAQGATR